MENIQNILKIGYLGPTGSHSHQAALAWTEAALKGPRVPLQPLLAPFPSLDRLMAASESGEVQLAILPFENALEGSVMEVLETLGLQKRALMPLCEFLLPVAHALVAHPHRDKSQPIHKVISHPQALAQCREHLHSTLGHELQLEWAPSTSEAMRRVAEQEDYHGCAALGTHAAARQYGLEILEENMSDVSDNMTRFFVVYPASTQHAFYFSDLQGWLTDYPHKTSLCFGVPERPGALVDVLLMFKIFNVNLTKIESRPSKKRFGEYMFHIDTAQNLEEPQFSPLRSTLPPLTTTLQVLGPYASIGLLPLCAPATPA